MARELAVWIPEVDDPPAPAIARPAWVRAAEELAPVGARLFGRRHFRGGVDRAGCRAIHAAAARGSLYGFAPPPQFTRVRAGRGRRPVDWHRARAPLVSGLAAAGGTAASGTTWLRHHRGQGGRHALVVLTPGIGLLAGVVARRLAAALVVAGFDVAIPLAAADGAAGGDGDWARTVGSALATVVRRVHDAVAVEAWGRALGYRTIVATGVGIGGTATALVAATTSRFDAAVPILAGAHPGRLWIAPRALARAADHRALAEDEVRQVRTLLRLFDPIAPSRLPPPRRREGAAVAGFRYDRQVPPADVQALADHWRVRPVWLERSHVELPLAARTLATVVAHAARVSGLRSPTSSIIEAGFHGPR